MYRQRIRNGTIASHWKKKELPPFGPKYGPAPNKVKTLQKEISKEGLMQTLKLLAGALILFIGTRRKKSWCCINY